MVQISRVWVPKDLVLKGLKSPCVEAPEIHPYFVSPCKEFLMIPYISLSYLSWYDHFIPNCTGSCSDYFKFFFNRNYSIYNCIFGVSIGRWHLPILPSWTAHLEDLSFFHIDSFLFVCLFLFLFYLIFLTLQYCIGFCHIPTWIHHRYTRVPHPEPSSLLPPPSPYHPSGSSQCTSPKHPVSCIKPGLATYFIYNIIHVSMPFCQIIQSSPSPTESKRLFYTSVSLLLSCIQGYCYHLSKFHIYALVYCIGVFLSGLLHSV